MARLDGKVAVITGGGSGIGRVAATLFANEGARIVVADVVAEHAESVVVEIMAAGGEATAFTVDVSNEAQVQPWSGRRRAYGRTRRPLQQCAASSPTMMAASWTPHRRHGRG